MIPIKVFDSYAFFVFFQDEENADKVENLLLEAEKGNIRILLNIVNWGEIYYIIMRKFGEETAEKKMREIEQMPVEVILLDRELAREAARIKACHTLSYADSFAAALTKMGKGELITGDKEFKSIEKEISIFWI